MDSLMTAAARALAAGDILGALKRVALRHDAPALALRGVAMARLGDFVRAKALLQNAQRAFGPREAVARASYEASIPLDAFIYFPTNPVKKPVKSTSFASVSATNVLISTMKKAENEKSLVIRLWETGGKATRFTLVVEGKKYPLTIGAWQLKTVLISKSKGKLTEADMLERPLKK